MTRCHRSNMQALEIYQDVLDRMATAYLSLDTAAILEDIKFPHVYRTLNLEVLLETPEDYLRSITALGQSLRGYGVDSVIRLASESEFLGPEYIQGFHATHLLRNGVRVFPGFTNRMVLHRDGGRWRVAEHDSALYNDRWPFQTLQICPDVEEFRARTGSAEDVRATSPAPIALYQAFLDRLSAASMTDDFQAFCDCCAFPYTSHTQTVDTLLDGPDDARPFFDMIAGIIRDHDIDRFERKARLAEFVSGTRICGYHTARFYSGDAVALGPVESRIILEHAQGAWKMKSVANAVDARLFPFESFEPTEGPVTLHRILERNRS